MDQLEGFYREIKSGMTVKEFINRRNQLTPFIIESEELKNDYRLAKGRLKKLRDEIAPMTRFVSVHAETEDRIQFPFDNGPIDCNLWHGKNRHRKIQITGAQRLERLNLMGRLNKTGKSGGYLGLIDNEPKEEFLKKMNEDLHVYSIKNARETVIKAVRRCIVRKADSREADTLIIDVPLHYLPSEKWRGIEREFSRETAKSPFSEIFLVGVDNGGNQCILIK